MNIELLGTGPARALLSRELGVAPSPDGEQADHEETAITALRHAASRLCPCSQRTLIAAVTTALAGILDEEPDLSALVDAALEAMVGAGDLIREADAESGRRLVYLSPPLFVRSAISTIYLVGGFPEDDWPLDRQSIIHGAYRRLSPAPADEELRELGIAELPLEAWLEHPTTRQAQEILAELDAALGEAGPAGSLLDLQIVDPEIRGNYYLGRFVVPSRQTGTFIARRKVTYGADAWSYVEMANGEPIRFVDLPQVDPRFRACDEAWWVMCAIDVLAGHPQELRVAEAGGAAVLAFNMPMPMWVDRRLAIFGQPADRPLGSLFAYLLESEDAAREIEFLNATLWLSPTVSNVGV